MSYGRHLPSGPARLAACPDHSMWPEDWRTAAESCGKAYTLATLAGEIDVTNSGGLRDLLEVAVAEGARTLVVDLSAVSFMDSSGLNVLLQVARVLQRQGGTLSVVSPQGAVNMALRLCAADQLIPIRSSVTEAVGG